LILLMKIQKIEATEWHCVRERSKSSLNFPIFLKFSVNIQTSLSIHNFFFLCVKNTEFYKNLLRVSHRILKLKSVKLAVI
jgi:hypothetical protein